MRNDSADKERQVRRVLVPYDGSPVARAALVRAAELARPGDKVIVVNVMPEPGVSAHIGPPPTARQRQWELLDEAGRLLAAHGVEAHADDPVGSPAAEITAAAERLGADLIVLGCRHRHRGSRVHGRTSARVIRDARCDVLVVHEDQSDKPGP